MLSTVKPFFNTVRPLHAASVLPFPLDIHLSHHTSSMNSSTIANLSINGFQALLQEKYSTHRRTRNAQQKANLLSPTFPGLILDGILLRREDPTISPGYVDPRNSLVFWGRLPPQVLSLATTIQAKLKGIAPRMYLVPLPRPIHFGSAS